MFPLDSLKAEHGISMLSLFILSLSFYTESRNLPRSVREDLGPSIREFIQMSKSSATTRDNWQVDLKPDESRFCFSYSLNYSIPCRGDYSRAESISTLARCLHQVETAGLIPNITPWTMSVAHANGENLNNSKICSRKGQRIYGMGLQELSLLISMTDHRWYGGIFGLAIISILIALLVGPSMLYDLGQQNISSTHFLIGANILNSLDFSIISTHNYTVRSRLSFLQSLTQLNLCDR